MYLNISLKTSLQQGELGILGDANETFRSYVVEHFTTNINGTQYNFDMPPNSPYKVPDYVTNDAELRIWYEQEFEKLSDEPAPGKELELLRCVNSYYRKLGPDTNTRLNRNDHNPYKGPLVSALMESGWDLKRNSQKSKTLRPDAIRVFEEALRIIPENPKACYRLGHLLKSRGKIGEAIGYFSRALELASIQADFQGDLILSSAQIANASGLAITLMQRVLNPLDLGNEPTFNPEVISTLQDFVRETHDLLVVYTTKVGRSIVTNTISSWDYDDLIRNLRGDEKALVIDRFNKLSLIRYQDKEKYYEYDTERWGKLYYLLTAMGLEYWDLPSNNHNTRTQNVHRINADLINVEADQRVEIAYSRVGGGRLYCSKCDLTIHYFKSLLD